ncbi:tumor necrosis factor receptor superfamily member 8 [Suncus etruscus]|uniref:tumor necrosis factor receptor superfamily member 8 n=1 Tax=Suncus etruscus TaxID=109475 RepID=UPI002110085B|nr:tumor necrosis factor receptor superfamily member 8 [Suncus etruscus]
MQAESPQSCSKTEPRTWIVPAKIVPRISTWTRVLGDAAAAALQDTPTLCPLQPVRLLINLLKAGQGHVSLHTCPQQASQCRKPCDPEYYLSPEGRCTACVGCSRDDLVEKQPCTWNSTRVCTCRPGMFCVTAATNSCARCSPHSTCSPGYTVKFQGTTERDTICGTPPPGTSAEDGGHAVRDIAESSLTSQDDPKARITHRNITHTTPEDAPKRMLHPPSSAGKSRMEQHAAAPVRKELKQCDPEYYLDRSTGRCMACVSCSQDKDLVEKTPCLWNASRVCTCRPGLICVTSAANSCARCIPDPNYLPTPTLQDTAERNGTHRPSLHPKDWMLSSVTPSLSPLVNSQTSKVHEGDNSNISTSYSVEKSVFTAGPVIWLLVVLILAGGTISLILCNRHWACGTWLRHNSGPGRNPMELEKITMVAEAVTEDAMLLSAPTAETCPPPTNTTSCPENLPLLDASTARNPSAFWDVPEPRGASEHTNNRIEKIYIMKADTVIVGSVKTEVPETRSPAVLVEPELQEDLEVDSASHYPEQETEPPQSSGGDLMFSVEEEGKLHPLPTPASGD